MFLRGTQRAEAFRRRVGDVAGNTSVNLKRYLNHISVLGNKSGGVCLPDIFIKPL